MEDDEWAGKGQDIGVDDGRRNQNGDYGGRSQKADKSRWSQVGTQNTVRTEAKGEVRGRRSHGGDLAGRTMETKH